MGHARSAFLGSLLFFVLFPSLSGISASAQPVPLGTLKTIDSWQVGTVDAKDMSYCAMVADAEGQAIIAFARAPDGTASLALDFPDQLFEDGADYDVTLRSSEAQDARHLSARSSSTGAIVIQIGRDDRLMEELSANQTLSVSAKPFTVDLKLPQFSEGYKDLLTCATRVAETRLPAVPVADVAAAPSQNEAGDLLAPQPPTSPQALQQAQNPLDDALMRIAQEEKPPVQTPEAAVPKMATAAKQSKAETPTSSQKFAVVLKRSADLQAALNKMQERQAAVEKERAAEKKIYAAQTEKLATAQKLIATLEARVAALSAEARSDKKSVANRQETMNKAARFLNQALSSSAGEVTQERTLLAPSPKRAAPLKLVSLLSSVGLREVTVEKSAQAKAWTWQHGKIQGSLEHKILNVSGDQALKTYLKRLSQQCLTAARVKIDAADETPGGVLRQAAVICAGKRQGFVSALAFLQQDNHLWILQNTGKKEDKNRIRQMGRDIARALKTAGGLQTPREATASKREATPPAESALPAVTLQ